MNIAGMHLGRERQGGKALALLLIDNPVGKEVIEQVRQIPNILSAKVVRVLLVSCKSYEKRKDPFCSS